MSSEELTAEIRTILAAGPLGPSAIYGKLAPELQRLYSLRVVSELLYKMRREGSLRVNGSGRQTRYDLAERRQVEHAPVADDELNLGDVLAAVLERDQVGVS